MNRLTLRQAISQLTQEGFLIAKRGEGTFVTHNKDLINSFSLEFTGFMDDLFYQVSKIRAKSVIINNIKSPKLIREKLELDIEEDDVVQIKRVRLLREQMFSYTINYLPIEIGMKISEKELYKKPLLKIMQEDLGIQFTEAFQTIEASFANKEVAANLQIPVGSPVLYLERIMYMKGRKPVEFVQSFHRGDIYKYVLRLRSAKRRKMNNWAIFT